MNTAVMDGRELSLWCQQLDAQRIRVRLEMVTEIWREFDSLRRGGGEQIDAYIQAIGLWRQWQQVVPQMHELQGKQASLRCEYAQSPDRQELQRQADALQADILDLRARRMELYRALDELYPDEVDEFLLSDCGIKKEIQRLERMAMLTAERSLLDALLERMENGCLTTDVLGELLASFSVQGGVPGKLLPELSR